MKTLVLCIDRDDDVGAKTGFRGPIIGRADNLAVALRLGLADPEDSDVNTIFSAITIYDDLVGQGEDVEIATLCGDRKVGAVADRIIASQLDEVLEEVRPDVASLISDGAEDESVFHLVSSRIRINHVKRVIVKQHPGLESTVYVVTKAFKEEKVRRKFLPLIGLPLLAYGLVVLLTVGILVYNKGILELPTSNLAGGLIAFLLGAYLLFSAYAIGRRFSDFLDQIEESYRSFKFSLISGDVSVYFTITAVVLMLLSFFLGLEAFLNRGSGILQKFLYFLGSFLWPFILGLEFYEAGFVVTAYLKRGSLPSHTFPVMGGILAVGLFVGFLTFTFGLLVGITDLPAGLGLYLVVIGFALALVIATYVWRRSRGAVVEVEEGWWR